MAQPQLEKGLLDPHNVPKQKTNRISIKQTNNYDNDGGKSNKQASEQVKKSYESVQLSPETVVMKLVETPHGNERTKSDTK